MSSNDATTDETQSKIETKVNNIYTDVFTKSNVILLFYFISLYFLIYFTLGLIYKKDNINDAKLASSKILDLMVLGFVIVFIVARFFMLSGSEKEEQLKAYINQYGSYIDRPISVLSLVLFLAVFYGLIYITGVPMEYTNKPTSISIVETLAWVTFTITIFVNFFRLVFGISLPQLFGEFLKGIWTGFSEEKKADEGEEKKGDDDGDKDDKKKADKSEVFNVGNNLYTYDDAKTLCSAYGARLATYDEIEDAYNKGAEWCNYGWSDGQMAYFPTQKSTWDKLQDNPKTKNNCGRPGINGGYMKNPNIRFGANCYGKRPAPSARDKSLMDVKKAGIITPRTPEDILLEKKIQYWKENKEKIVTINGFNNDKWSEY